MAKTDYVVRLNGEDNLSPMIDGVRKSLEDMGKTGTKLDDLKGRFKKIIDSSAPLNRKISDIRKEMERLAQSEDINTREGRKMWEQLSNAAREYDRTLQRIREDSRHGNLVPDAGKGFDIKSLTSGMADRLGLGGVSSQLGSALSNPYVLAGAAIAGAGKALYDYNVELDRSLKKTEQFTGLSGDALMSLRNGIKSVADTFGKDYDTVLASVDGMMNQFGIDGEEALKIIRDGFVSGSDESGRMLDMISQYGPAFNDAGISASELVAIIGNTRSGIFSEDGMKLIQTGAKRIREMGKSTSDSLEGIGISASEMQRALTEGTMTTMEAIQKISERLKDLPPQSQEVGNVLKDVFGRQGSAAGLELVTALADVETSLEKVKGQTGEWGEAMEKLQEADREMENALASLFGIADGGFSTMTTKLKAEVYGAIADCINGFIDWYNQSIVLRGAIAGIALQFENAWEIIKGILRVFMDSMGALSNMIEAVFDLDWEGVKAAWNSGVQNILKDVSGAVTNMKDNIAGAMEQTLHGHIDKIETATEPEYSGNRSKGKGGSFSESEKEDSSSKSRKTKSEKPEKKEVTYDPGSIKYAQQIIRKLKEEEEEAADDSARAWARFRIDYWEKELKKRQGKVEEVKVEPVISPGSLADLQNRLKDVTEKLRAVDPEDAKTIAGLTEEYKGLTAQIKEMNVALGFEEGEDPLKKQQEAIEKYRDDLEKTTGAVYTMGGAFTALGGSIEGAGGKMLSFAGQSVQAGAQIAEQVSKLIPAKQAEALASGMASASGLPFPANLGAIASIVATITSLFASLPKFESGGIVPGGAFSGDRTLIRANAGEMILNKRQQNNLYRAISEDRLGGGGTTNVNVTGQFRIKNGDLVAVIENHNSKIRRQS